MYASWLLLDCVCGVIVRGHLKPVRLFIVFWLGGLSSPQAGLGRYQKVAKRGPPSLGSHQFQLPLRPHSKEAKGTCPGDSQSFFFFQTRCMRHVVAACPLIDIRGKGWLADWFSGFRSSASPAHDANCRLLNHQSHSRNH